MNIAVIGGGAAGFFGAIACAEANPACRITLFERGKSVLEKVRISGGGRCNVTHACFEPSELVKFYPRGSRELLGPFRRFGPEQTVEWYERHGVALKTEADGRMFPQSDDSQTIVDCLTRNALRLGIRVLTSARVENIRSENGGWRVGETHFDKVLVTTGSNPSVWEWLAALGHPIVPPVPSIFTFNTKDLRLKDLAGVSAPEVLLRIPGTKLSARGPLLVTHWGLSGPAVLRLSAWGARELQALGYKFPLEVNFSGKGDIQGVVEHLQRFKTENGKKSVSSTALFDLPSRLWQRMPAAAGIDAAKRWGDLNKNDMQALAAQLFASVFQITGKSTFKEEFVTAGGVSLKALNFKTFESNICPGLYLAGEVLDIDGITGGFNFQAAWTGGYIAGTAMAISE